MALVDNIEFYGRAVDARELSRAEAARLLAEASNGGLTDCGAGTAIDQWQTARDQYAQTFANAAASLDKIYGLDDIKP